MFAWCLILPFLLDAQSADAASAIEPSRVPISWEFDFRYVEPRRIEVTTRAGRQTYWYLLYTVVNRSGATQTFHPTFELVTQDLRVLSTDKGISATVFEAIRERHQRTHPYLVHPTRAIGDLRVGDDYAIESVAIWRASDVGVNRFTIYVAGLSGEARAVPNPAFDPEKPESIESPAEPGAARPAADNPRFFTLRKTLELSYLLPGSDEALRGADAHLSRARWILR